MAGYSGTPLARKLGLKDGQRAWWSGMPAAVRREIDAAGLALRRLAAPEAPIDAAHVFVTRRAELARRSRNSAPCWRPPASSGCRGQRRARGARGAE